MVRVRVQGPPAEVASFADALCRAGVVLGRSRPYANRGGGRLVRVYLEAEAPTRGARELPGERRRA